jgi:cell division protein FtsI (penicillin-binding protein 3)
LVAIAIAVKLTNIQWVEGDYYRKLAKERTVKNFVIPANKGIYIHQTEFISYFNS